MITVMGATGQIGQKLTRYLLDQGETARALGRSENKLAEIKEAGAEVRAGDAHDTAFLTDAFRGADAVYAMLPSDPTAADYDADADRLGKAIVQALGASGVRFAVCLSSIGADQPSGTGYIASLYRQEQRLRTLQNTNVLVLRPGYFFENFYGSLELIIHQGINGDAVAPDVALPMIATRDIAQVAARALTTRDWEGFVVRELPGPSDLTLAKVTRIIGERIGKPGLPYVQFSDAEMAAALAEMGFSAHFAALHSETARALNTGTIRPLEPRTPENTTPTRFEDFVEELADAYDAYKALLTSSGGTTEILR